jgi:N-acetyl-anhydromuramoyl-L-alanine amidase
MSASRVPGRRDPRIDGDRWLTTATRLPSPNIEARCRGALPTLIVVNDISPPPGR